MDIDITLADALGRARSDLKASGVENERREARLLTAHVLDIEEDQVFLRPERKLATGQAELIAALVARRCAGEPLSRILGRREFWSLSFDLTPATLDPRPDSETLIEAVLAARPDRQAALRVLDLGTGSGCLLAALLSEYPNARGSGVDVSIAAVGAARHNMRALGFAGRSEIRQGGWATASGSFEIIVCNPPYIPSGEIARLEAGVRDFDPALALDGGADGLQAYRDLAPALARSLMAEGLAAVEVGAGQAADVSRIFAAQRLEIVDVRRDLAGIERCILASPANNLTEK